MNRDHDYTQRWDRLVTSDDHEIERGGRCYRCRSLHIAGVRAARCGSSPSGRLALGVLALASVIAASACLL